MGFDGVKIKLACLHDVKYRDSDTFLINEISGYGPDKYEFKNNKIQPISLFTDFLVFVDKKTNPRGSTKHHENKSV